MFKKAWIVLCLLGVGSPAHALGSPEPVIHKDTASLYLPNKWCVLSVPVEAMLFVIHPEFIYVVNDQNAHKLLSCEGKVWYNKKSQPRPLVHEVD